MMIVSIMMLVLMIVGVVHSSFLVVKKEDKGILIYTFMFSVGVGYYGSQIVTMLG